MGHDRHEPRANVKHEATVQKYSRQERISSAQYDTRDTYIWRIYKKYERYNAQIGYASMHVLYVLSLLPTYRATVLRFLAHRSCRCFEQTPASEFIIDAR